ncbi:MAG: DNA-binding protein [Thermoplasmata archaeon]|nr:DNA-binding protein [Thermoplasmata archaeon]
MQRVRDGARWMLRLDEGQDLFATLAAFATEESIRAGVVVSGIGMLRRATLGYWNGREYSPMELKVPHELVALHGSIAVVDGAPSIHLHASVSGPEHQTVSGHVMQATIGILGEIYVETFPNRTFGRPMNESVGLRGLDLEPGPQP